MTDLRNKNKEENHIPLDLNDCIRELDCMLCDSDKLNIENMSEEKFLAISHFRLGMWIRNNWKLWTGSRLSEYFNELGVYHPDYMSTIILIAYSRIKKGQELRMDELIRFYATLVVKKPDKK
jgi:hypothetical protein